MRRSSIKSEIILKGNAYQLNFNVLSIKILLPQISFAFASKILHDMEEDH